MALLHRTSDCPGRSKKGLALVHPEVIRRILPTWKFRLDASEYLSMTELLHIKIFRLRMMHDDGVGALFRDKHEIFADADADLLGAQQSHYVPAILQVRAGRAPEAVPAAALLLLEDLLDRLIVLSGESQLLAHTLV